MSDQKPETPQDADVTQSLPTASTQHLPDHGPGSAAWTTWVPASAQQHETPTPTAAPHEAAPEATTTPAAAPASWSPPQGGPSWTPPPVSSSAPAPVPAPQPQPRPQVTYLPPPTGPNWGLVIIGLVFGLVGAGVVANQVAGFQVSSLSELGPSVLVIAGLSCALLGMVGIVTRRRRG